MSEQKSFSELIREYIEEKHQSNPDYWNSISVENRNRDFSTYCDQYKNQGLNFGKHQSLFTQQLAKLKKKLNINVKIEPKHKKSPSKSFQVTTGSQTGNIKVEPKLTPSTSTTTTTDDKGKSTETKIAHPSTCQCTDCKVKRGEMEMLDAEMCGAIPEIMIDIWHMKNPRVKPLSEHEVLRVGKSLRPAFLRIFHNNENLLLYAVPLMVCGQIFAERLGQSRNPNEKKKKEKDRDYSDEPAQDSNTDQIETEEIPRRKMYNSAKIDKIIKDAENEDDE